MYPSREGCKPPDRGRCRRTDFRPEITRCISLAGVSKALAKSFAFFCSLARHPLYSLLQGPCGDARVGRLPD